LTGRTRHHTTHTPEDAAALRVADWTRDYTPLTGVPDEYIGPDGKPRAHWTTFLNAFAAINHNEMDRRFASADRYIRDMGVSYRSFGDNSERAWPLSHIPLLIDEKEWAIISAGVIQRAELLDRVLSDLYGPATLISSGALPAAAVTGSGDFLRPMIGLTPRNKRWLNLYAVDIGRGPDGRWWVLGDRTQAPSGAGYALENRLVLSRAFPQLYSQMNVERLAPFFREFRDGLTSATERHDPRICLLSSGSWSETYFEQAYLARYLGFLLVEGEDLFVRDGIVYVRTIAGPKRADILWRRVDGDFCDPLELNASSRLGIPGLLNAIRSGSVNVANMPGSGLLESRALMSFLPRLARHLLGEDLLIPNIATWWCGQSHERNHVINNMQNLALASAFGQPISGWDQTLISGTDLSPQLAAQMRSDIEQRGVDYVGQEIVQLSTTPFMNHGRLEPRPFVLRVYVSATADGSWNVMPGGFCRVSDRLDARAISMRDGASSADVWLLSDKPVAAATLLPTADDINITRYLGNLPSRAADNLFWFGRYVERLEATLRLVRSLCGRGLYHAAHLENELSSAQKLQQLLRAWGALGESDKTKPAFMPSATAATLALHKSSHYGSALALTKSALRAASVIRERLSPDAWRLLHALETNLNHDSDEPISEPEAYDRANDALQLTAALSGLMKENINRVAGWRFLELGRRIERAINTCRFARHLSDQNASEGDLDVLLDLIDSHITYHSRYLIGLARKPVRDLVLLDPFNPRSVAFQVERTHDHLKNLPRLSDNGMLELPQRIAQKLATDLATSNENDINTAMILTSERNLMSLADAIAQRFFLHGAATTPDQKWKGLV